MRIPLKRLLLAKLVVTVIAVGLPCLLLPARWFDALGLPVTEALAGPLFLKLFGAAILALCSTYLLGLLRPAALGYARLTAIVSNGAIAAVVWAVMFQGGFSEFPFRGKLVVAIAAAAATLLAVLFLVARGEESVRPSEASLPTARAALSGQEADRSEAVVVEPEILPPSGV